MDRAYGTPGTGVFRLVNGLKSVATTWFEPTALVNPSDIS